MAEQQASSVNARAAQHAPVGRAAPRRQGPQRVARARDGRVILVPLVPTPFDDAMLALRRFGPALVAVLGVLGYWAGAFGPRGRMLGLATTSAMTGAAAAAFAWRWQRRAQGRPSNVRADLAIAWIGAQAAFAIVQFTGDVRSDLYPLLYLASALIVLAPLPRNVALWSVAGLVVENAVRHAGLGAIAASWPALVAQSAFLVLFAVLYHLLLAARFTQSRTTEETAAETRRREAEAAAALMRLAVADRSQDEEDAAGAAEAERKRVLASVVEVERGVGSVLDVAALSLQSHALAFYELSTDDKTLRLKDGRCAAGLLAPGPLSSGDGVLGQVLRSGAPVRQAGRIDGIHWLARSVDVRSVVAVPVVERAPDGAGWVRGVVVADRLDAEPFTEAQQRLLEECAAQLARAVEAERLVHELHRSKRSQDRLTRGADVLNRAASLEEVAEATARILVELVPDAEIAALTRVEQHGNDVSHVVASCAGKRADEFHGLVYDDNDGLVAHAVRIGSPLPARAPGVLERIRLFDLRIAGTGSLRVVPLVAGGRTLGTLVVAVKARGRLDGGERTAVDGLAGLVAGALARAQALAEVSAAATTDALTGLANRRHTEDFARRALEEATRYQRPFSVLVTDVDHFKKVNDTYGHDGGDAVLKAVAAALKAEARNTDLAGRWGGEEFILVLPQTTQEGAVEFAERVRKRVESTLTKTAGGDVRVTLSIGVAAFPAQGKTLEALVKSGDEALYAAKQGGRNRVVVGGA